MSRRIRRIVASAAVVLAASSVTPARGSQADILRAGANRLVRLQADITADNAGNGNPDIDPDDGGWDRVVLTTDLQHSSNASSTTTYGITAIGMALALQKHAASINSLTACLDTYTGMASSPLIAAGPDPSFLFFMTRLTNDRTFADEARGKWDIAINSLGGGDVQAAGRAIKQARTDQGIPDLYPWDISWFVISATRLDRLFPGQGFALSASLLSQVVLNDLLSPNPTFDVADGTKDFYDLGLIGALLTIRLTGISPTQAAQLLTRVLARQNPDGSWGFSDLMPQGNLQSTAYAVIANHLYRGRPDAAAARQAGANYLAALQGANGGFPFNGGPTEITEANSEVLLAIGLVAPTIPFGAQEPPSFGPPTPVATPLEFDIP